MGSGGGHGGHQEADGAFVAVGRSLFCAGVARRNLLLAYQFFNCLVVPLAIGIQTCGAVNATRSDAAGSDGGAERGHVLTRGLGVLGV